MPENYLTLSRGDRFEALGVAATDDAAGTWEGRTHFCVVPDSKFTIPGRANCGGRGFGQRGFFEVDTGGAADWTQTLSN